jgi:membrane-bound lytic murein transglycosylase D
MFKIFFSFQLILWVLAFDISPSLAASNSPSVSPFPSGIQDRLKKHVDFWIKIYSQYGVRQGLIHDAKYIDHIYEVVDLSKVAAGKAPSVRESRKKWKQVLLSVHQKQDHPEEMTDEERKVFELFKDVQESNKFLNAAHRKRLRFQLGQKESFLSGLYQSGKYLPWMEEVFAREGMPLELTRLPFVESSFNVNAYSKVGASGIWQFMGSTAQLFIEVNEAVDERNDPIRATEAAAQLLKLNFSSLKSWPLAVTAYNHGRKGVMRAIRKVENEELEDLLVGYHQRTFGFASSNFYTELLAAVEVERNASQYFGKIERAQPTPYFEVKLPDFIMFHQLIRLLRLDFKLCKELNLGLTQAVLSGKLRIPSNYKFRVPMAVGTDVNLAIQNFWEKYNQIPKTFKQRAQRSAKYVTKVSH